MESCYGWTRIFCSSEKKGPGKVFSKRRKMSIIINKATVTCHCQRVNIAAVSTSVSDECYKWNNYASVVCFSAACMFSPICNTVDLKLKTSKRSFAVCLGIESRVIVYIAKHCWSIIGHCPQGYKTRKKMLISFSTASTIGQQTWWIWGYESSDLQWTDKHFWTTTTTMSDFYRWWKKFYNLLNKGRNLIIVWCIIWMKGCNLYWLRGKFS